MSVGIDFVIEGGRPRKRVYTVGGPDFSLHDLTPEDLASEPFQRFTAGVPLGTPLEELIGRPWFGGKITEQMIVEWRAVQIRTVEDMADILDSAPGVGMKAAIRKLAKEYLDEKARKAAKAKVPATTENRLDALENGQNEIKAQLVKLTELLAAKGQTT